MKRSPVAGLAALALASGQLCGDVTFTPIALTGQQAPGVPDATYAFLSDATINAAGDVAFWAQLAGTGVTPADDGSIWVRTGGTPELALREGDAVPGLPGQVFAAFPRPAFNASGELAYTGVIVPATQESVPINIGVFSDVQGLLAREGEQAAGLPAGTNYAGFTGVALTSGGAAVWQGNAGAAAWMASPSQLPSAIAVRGASIPGAGTFDYIDDPGTASGGGLVFRATVQGSPTSMGLWTDAAQPAIAMTGAALPGAPAGVVYDEFTMGPLACAGGCVAFWTSLVGPGIFPENDGAVVAGPADAPAVIARDGQPAPGTTGNFGVISPGIAISAGGAVAFHTSLAGAGVTTDDNTALYIAAAGAPVLVAREGAAAPGLPAGTLFAGFGEPVLSPTGELAFVARLRGPDVTPATSRALYIRGASGDLNLCVRTGQNFDTGGGLRTVEEIMLDQDHARAGHAAFEAVGGVPVLVFKLHFKEPGPGTAFHRSSGLYTAALGAGACYANCDGSTAQPILNIADFGCFLQRFAAGEGYANCDGSTGDPALNVADFTCFLQRFGAGCR